MYGKIQIENTAIKIKTSKSFFFSSSVSSIFFIPALVHSMTFVFVSFPRNSAVWVAPATTADFFKASITSVFVTLAINSEWETFSFVKSRVLTAVFVVFLDKEFMPSKILSFGNFGKTISGTENFGREVSGREIFGNITSLFRNAGRDNFGIITSLFKTSGTLKVGKVIFGKKTFGNLKLGVESSESFILGNSTFGKENSGSFGAETFGRETSGSLGVDIFGKEISFFRNAGRDNFGKFGKENSGMEILGRDIFGKTTSLFRISEILKAGKVIFGR